MKEEHKTFLFSRRISFLSSQETISPGSCLVHFNRSYLFHLKKIRKWVNNMVYKQTHNSSTFSFNLCQLVDQERVRFLFVKKRNNPDYLTSYSPNTVNSQSIFQGYLSCLPLYFSALVVSHLKLKSKRNNCKRNYVMKDPLHGVYFITVAQSCL